MRIAVLSDSHDHIANLRAAVTYCNAFSVNVIIHCGDLISPFMLAELAAFGGAVHLVYGNNVGDLHLITRMCEAQFPTITHHGSLGAIEAAGLKIAFHHYPVIARGAAQQTFDIVCCGHNHTYTIEKTGNCLLINPGELLGKEGTPSFCIVDTTTLNAEKVEVGNPMF